MRAASDCRPPLTARHASPPRTAPATPPSKRTQSTAAPLHGEGGQRRRRTAAPRHTDGCGPRPCSAPAAPRPATAAPHDTSPANNNKAGGKEDILSSATGLSTARCSKDITTHQHRPRARRGRLTYLLSCGFEVAGCQLSRPCARSVAWTALWALRLLVLPRIIKSY